MKLDSFISHLRSIMLKEGNLDVYIVPMFRVEKESLVDKDILYITDENSTKIYIGTLVLERVDNVSQNRES